MDTSAGPEERLLRRARTPDDARALVRFDDAMALPLVLAAVMPIVLAPGDQQQVLAAVVNIAAWGVFVVDFVVHQRRLQGFLSTWLGRFDLALVVLTAPWFLFVDVSQTRFVLLIRLARLGRLVMAGAGARRLVERLGRVVLVAAAVVFLGAAVAYGAEHATNPEFGSYGDALWWAVVTLATVGYGDIVPETVPGRLTGVMVMITGIGVLGVLAGSLAGFFRLAPQDGAGATDGPAGGTPAVGDAELAREVAELRRQVERLAARLEAGAGPGDPPAA